MIRSHILATSVACIALFCSLSAAQDLSQYRGFQLGMSLDSVLTQTQMKITEVKVVHQRPYLIQTLDWDQFHGNFMPIADSLRSLQFDFYNGGLFKVVATYDPTRTQGLTTEDVIDAISIPYGKATTPGVTIDGSSAIASHDTSDKVLAHWEDAQYSYSLFRSPYRDTYSLVGSSKELDILAVAAGRESDRLDKEEAPAREAARQIKQDEDIRAAQAAARTANKPKFKP